ncbi:hypothetical protein D3C72_1388700 [compost metagenome]
MRVGLQFAQVVTVLFKAASLLPEIHHPRVVLPTIEALQVCVDLQGAQRHPSAQPRVEAPVHFTTGFRRTTWMALAFSDLHLLRIGTGKGLPQPRLR